MQSEDRATDARERAERERRTAQAACRRVREKRRRCMRLTQLSLLSSCRYSQLTTSFYSCLLLVSSCWLLLACVGLLACSCSECWLVPVGLFQCSSSECSEFRVWLFGIYIFAFLDFAHTHHFTTLLWLGLLVVLVSGLFFSCLYLSFLVPNAEENGKCQAERQCQARS